MTQLVVVQKGLSPESIIQSFPLLTLDQVYGAIAFYLAKGVKDSEVLAIAAQQEHRLVNKGNRQQATKRLTVI